MAIDFFEKVNELVNDTYEFVPDIGTHEYHRFIAEAQAYFVRDLVGKDWDNRVKIDPACSTAYTDLKDIYMSANLFRRSWFEEHLSGYELNTQDVTNLSVMATNGFLLHEAGHIFVGEEKAERCTPQYFDEVERRIYKKTDEIINLNDRQKYQIQVLWNVVEDVYVNELIQLRFSDKAPFLVMMLYYLFNREYAGICFDAFKANPNMDSAVTFLTFYSNPSSAKVNDEWYQYFINQMNILDEVKNISFEDDFSITKRMDAVVDLFISLQQDSDEDQDQGEGEGEDGENEDGESAGGQGDSGEDGEGGTFDEYLNGFDVIFNDNAGEDTNEGKNNTIAEDINRIIIEVIEEERERKADLEAKLALKKVDGLEVQFSDIIESSTHEDRGLKPDRKFLRFGMALRVAREIRRYKGMPKDNGSIINKLKLNRIVTDSKIFQKRDAKKLQRGSPEVIFLLDISGSTCWGRDEDGKDLLSRIIEAAMGAFDSLRNAKVPCAVYAHTSKRRYYTDPTPDASIIYGVASYEMPLLNKKKMTNTTNWKERFNRLRNVDHNANADGTAINFVSHRFTKKSGTKVIVVLSDGRPTIAPSDFYASNGRDDEDEYARVMVEDARSRQIGVISLSLDRDVIRNNDDIYGKRFNVDAHKNLNEKMRELISEIGM